MIALVLASLVSIAPAPPAPDCGPPPAVATAQTGQQHARKLTDLPDAEMDLAVIRSIGACYVREVVRFKVSDRNPPGRGAALPTPGYTGRLVPEGAVTSDDAGWTIAAAEKGAGASGWSSTGTKSAG